MLFSRSGPGFTATAAAAVDAAMLRANIEKHVAKDETDVVDSTCVGVRLVGGVWWWPPSERLWALLLSALWVCGSRRGSSAGLLSLLGVLQWFDLLERGKFAFYAALYRETSDWKDWNVRVLPSDALRELACGIVLAPFWGVNMRLPHLPFIGATDASSDFGIGGCTADIGISAVSELARFAEREGAYVTLAGVTDKPRSRSLGEPHNLGIGFS